MGLKPCDSFCIPLSVEEHTEQHEISEKVYWGSKLEDAKRLARDLFAMSGNTQAAIKRIVEFRRVL